MRRLLSIFNDFPLVELYYRRSANDGYHVRMEFPYELSPKRRLDIRAMCHDDEARLMYDKKRVQADAVIDYSVGVLFDKKDGVEAGIWRKYGP